MKNRAILFLAAASLAASGLLNSCSLDEYDPSTVSVDVAYSNPDGFQGLINSCYTNLYYLYGKSDFLGPGESGTDYWHNVGSKDRGLSLYDASLNTLHGANRVIWNALYATVNYCNTAIHFGQQVDLDEEVRKARLAEAYFMRAFCNFLLVEHWGGVVLRTTSSTLEGVDNMPRRSTEEAFYELILSDLKFATQNLPYEQPERGRATRKAAYALLAKAALQRTRLGDEQTYARMALEAADELIANGETYNCGLWESDAGESGFKKLFAGENNKDNKEFLFMEAVDHAAGLNPDGWNRGRNRQYYLPALGSNSGKFGASNTSILYGRSNDRWFRPTKYLLTELFEPVENPADTRFEETFNIRFYAYNDSAPFDEKTIADFHKDPSLLGHVVKGTVGKAPSTNIWGNGINIEEVNNMEGDEGLAMFTPNWVIDSAVKARMPVHVVDPSDLFDEAGKYAGSFNNDYPAFSKFSKRYLCYSNQYWLGDIPILRLGEMYLIAAEACIRLDDKAGALRYITPVRNRAAVTGRQSELAVAEADMTLDFITAERGRELIGEMARWIDLKRLGKLTTEYLAETNPAITLFDPAKHLVRPVPQEFLDAITNGDEFGTNGY